MCHHSMLCSGWVSPNTLLYVARSGLCLVACLPYGGGCLFEKVGASFSRDPPPPWGGGRILVGLLCPMFLYIAGAEGAGNFFCIFPFVVLVVWWVGASSG